MNFHSFEYLWLGILHFYSVISIMFQVFALNSSSFASVHPPIYFNDQCHHGNYWCFQAKPGYDTCRLLGKAKEYHLKGTEELTLCTGLGAADTEWIPLESALEAQIHAQMFPTYLMLSLCKTWVNRMGLLTWGGGGQMALVWIVRHLKSPMRKILWDR